ncbi:MbnP family protein [Hymenobacter aerophilus]|uniref:MbnP family protein n=1 Tax=Hymenobacter aerophilus TaxID=119644 RepID=UPI00036393D5|nr:MbnP family protein [Hymenobacter aerophilus]
MFFSRFASVATSLALGALLLGSCTDKKDDPAAEPQTSVFSVELENTVGNRSLNLDTDTYTTAAGDQFTISTFKYYLSNLELLRADGSALALPDTYFLVDHANKASQKLELSTVPVGDYTGLRFVVGVDSARTKAGNFSGVLGDDQGMWWEWSKEFINVKLEGTSPQAAKGGLVFHIAGFKGANGANNTIRTVTLPFPSGSKLLVRPDHTPEIHLQVDAARMFSGRNTIRFATVSNTMGGPASVQVADNIAAGMFRIDHLHAN